MKSYKKGHFWLSHANAFAAEDLEFHALYDFCSQHVDLQKGICMHMLYTCRMKPICHGRKRIAIGTKSLAHAGMDSLHVLAGPQDHYTFPDLYD